MKDWALSVLHFFSSSPVSLSYFIVFQVIKQSLQFVYCYFNIDYQYTQCLSEFSRAIHDFRKPKVAKQLAKKKIAHEKERPPHFFALKFSHVETPSINSANMTTTRVATLKPFDVLYSAFVVECSLCVYSQYK